MQLNDFKPAWKQFKLLNSLEPIESKEILSIIEGAEASQTINSTLATLNIVMFVLITFICQGG